MINFFTELSCSERIHKGATHRNDPRDNHDDGEDQADHEHISFAVERTLLVLKLDLELILANFGHRKTVTVFRNF